MLGSGRSLQKSCFLASQQPLCLSLATSWVRAWFSLVCEFGGLAEEGGVSPYGESASCIICLSLCGGGPGCSSEGPCAGQCLALGTPGGHWFPADLPQEPVPTVAPLACQGLSVVPQETQGAKGPAKVRR